MPLYVPSVTVDQVIEALAAFVGPFVAPAHVVRGQSNRVAMPAAPFVELTEVLQAGLRWPSQDYQPAANTATIEGPKKIDIQIDFYGSQAGEFCAAVTTAFRSQWGCAQFPAAIRPLYCSDGMQAPLTTGEKQYESRWTLTVTLQYNPVITVPQEFADEARVNVKPPADQ